MLKIAVLNSKGGCGKSTLISNLASFFAQKGLMVGIADMDVQASSTNWLRLRPDNLPTVLQVAVHEFHAYPPAGLDVMLIDAPAGLSGATLSNVLQQTDKVIVPVLPSSIDIRAAGHFVYELLNQDAQLLDRLDLAVVANRVKTNTIAFHVLKSFLKRLDIPFISTIRDAQHYIQAAGTGMGIFDMGIVHEDVQQWRRITRWAQRKPAPATA